MVSQDLVPHRLVLHSFLKKIKCAGEKVECLIEVNYWSQNFTFCHIGARNSLMAMLICA
jgi:hypothetical protein